MENERPICDYCKTKPATWWYGPGDQEACDDCVPRGCSCNDHPIDGNYDNFDPKNWTPELDEKGRKLPCCEWFYYQDD